MTDLEQADEQPEMLRRNVVSPTGAAVRREVERLARGYLDNRSAAVAALAKLRNAVGKPLGADPEVLQWTIAALPEPAYIPDDGPTREELAAHTAVTLFAVHQQSLRDRRMHREGRSIASAAGILYARSPNQDGVLRRFEALGTAATWDETVRHARALIRMLNDARIALDYGFLTDDLLSMQFPGGADRVRLRWGREFYRMRERADSRDGDEESVG